MKTTPKFLLIISLCWWLLSCNENRQSTTNELSNINYLGRRNLSLENIKSSVEVSKVIQENKIASPSVFFKGVSKRNLNQIYSNSTPIDLFGSLGIGVFQLNKFLIKNINDLTYLSSEKVLRAKIPSSSLSTENINKTKEIRSADNDQNSEKMIKIINYRKNRHTSKIKFSHYDRHLTDTKNDFSADEFWASIAEFNPEE